MRSRNSIVLTAVIIISLIILLPVLFPLIGKVIDYSIEASEKNKAVKAARNGVSDYFYGKYSEYPEIADVEPVWDYYGYIIPDTKVFSGNVIMEEKSCVIYYNDVTKKFYDSRQYDDICSALTDKYFADEELGTNAYADIELEYDSQLCREKKTKNCTNAYFDGDIDGFLESAPCRISADIYYDGYPETGSGYIKLIEEQLDKLTKEFSNGKFSVNIKEPGLNLKYPKLFFEGMAYYGVSSDYCGLIARGEGSKGKPYSINFTKWCSLDDFTDMADISANIRADGSCFSFETDDSYDGKKVQTYSSGGDEYVLKGTAYKFRNSKSKDIFIRLDREKYMLDDNKIPIIVKKTNDGKLKPYLISTIRYGMLGNMEIMPDSWYMTDENYMYIYTYSDSVTVMFAELMG